MQATKTVIALAKILYKPDEVEVTLKTRTEELKPFTYKRRRTWSHKKYVDEAIKASGLPPAWDLTYEWAHLSSN